MNDRELESKSTAADRELLAKWRVHLFTLESIYHLGVLEAANHKTGHMSLGRAMEFFQEQEQRLKNEIKG